MCKRMSRLDMCKHKHYSRGVQSTNFQSLNLSANEDCYYYYNPQGPSDTERPRVVISRFRRQGVSGFGIKLMHGVYNHFVVTEITSTWAIVLSLIQP